MNKLKFDLGGPKLEVDGKNYYLSQEELEKYNAKYEVKIEDKKLVFTKGKEALKLENMQKSLKKNELLDSLSILTQRQNLFLSGVLTDKQKQDELEQEINSIKQEYLSLI